MPIKAALAAVVLGATQAVAADRNAGARFDWFNYRGVETAPAAIPGEYHNPILQGFYPDPSILRVGSDYYLANSTFAYFPGIPIFHSRDLVNWTQVGNAIDRPDQFNLDDIGVSEGMFAPSLSQHAGTWYIVNVCVNCGGNFVITAKNPAGPWSKPIFIAGLDGAIDASLFFDADDSSWIVYNSLPPGKPRYDGHRAIWMRRFDTATRQTSGERILLVDGGVHPDAQPIWIEGPHIIWSGGFYYLIAAEGGTAEGHSEVVFRSKSVTGPYVAGPTNPILTQRDLPGNRAAPITSSGHASFVSTPKGEWWAVFLATRPYGNDFYNTGRETFMLPVTWRDGWPQILPSGKVIPTVHRGPDLPLQPPSPIPTNGAFNVADYFNERALPRYWMMLRTPHQSWYKLHRGVLVLAPRSASIGGRGNPSLLARRQQNANSSATTQLRFTPMHEGERAGLVAFQNDAFWYFVGLERTNGRAVIVLDRRAGPDEPRDGTRVASAPFTGRNGAPIFLKIAARGASYDFYYGYKRERWQPLKVGEDGTVLSTKRAGGFVGAMFGLYAYDSTAKEGK